MPHDVRDAGVGLDPVPLEIGQQLVGGVPDRIDETRHRLEQRIRLEEPVVDRPPLGAGGLQRTRLEEHRAAQRDVPVELDRAGDELLDVCDAIVSLGPLLA